MKVAVATRVATFIVTCQWGAEEVDEDEDFFFFGWGEEKKSALFNQIEYEK